MVYIVFAVVGYFCPPLGLLLFYLADQYQW